MNPLHSLQQAASRRVPRAGAVALGAIAAVALVAIACSPTTEVTVQPPGPDQQLGISVTGSGRVFVQPDIARIDIGVEIEAETVEEARADASRAMSALREAVIGEGVDETDLRTRWFNIYPQYFYSDREAPEITGYVVNNQVEVTVRDIDNTSAVLDAAVAAAGDAVRVSNVSFTVDDPEAHLDDARADAIANARERAETLAAAAGVTLGAPRAITESTMGMPPPMPGFGRDGAFAEDAAATPIDPGEQELTVVVSVTFDIVE